MQPSKTLLLTQSDVARSLDPETCICAVEGAFRAYGGRARPPALCGIHGDRGAFHVKAGLMDLGRSYFAAKTNANFPGNPRRHELPSIQGTIALHDADDGRPLAILDSIEITSQRTAAASAVATRYLAREDASVVTICGCGTQGRAHLWALRSVRLIEKVFAFDAEPGLARSFADEMAAELAIELSPVDDLLEAVRASDITVTCTPSRDPLLDVGSVPPGAFVAAVGADNPDKHEITPALMASSTVVVDVLDQCAEIGDLQHALSAGTMSATDVHAELGDIVSGKKPGRTSVDEIVVFDSTGMALQDVATAALAYESAVREGYGTWVDFSA
jgi:ornithine cyclodeaminase/alanine dehydrogenase-like protein (mu-crystallin family)